MQGHWLDGLDYQLFDIPRLLVSNPCPCDLREFNRELAQIGGHEIEHTFEDGSLIPRLRAVWGGEELDFFCGDDIFKYTASVKRQPVGWSVLVDGRMSATLPLDESKWKDVLVRKHGTTLGTQFYRKAKAAKIRDLTVALICTGRQRVIVEEYVHPDAITGWEENRWWRELAGDDIDKRIIAEYNDWTKYEARLRNEGSADIEAKVAKWREVARKDGDPEVANGLDLPFELRCNLTTRRRDILGPLPEWGRFEALLSVQTEDEEYRVPDDEILETVKRFWHETTNARKLGDPLLGRRGTVEHVERRQRILLEAIRQTEVERAQMRAEIEADDPEASRAQVARAHTYAKNVGTGGSAGIVITDL